MSATEQRQPTETEVAPFLALLARDTDLVGSTFAVGKGLYVAWRRRKITV